MNGRGVEGRVACECVCVYACVCGEKERGEGREERGAKNVNISE